MRRLLLLLGLAAIAALWGWALLAPKTRSASPLDERFVGRFHLFRYEPPKGMRVPPPFPPGEQRFFVFKADGTYELRVLVSGDHELTRLEGYVDLDDDGILTITQVVENRKPAADEPQRYRASWERDKQGEYLLLTGEPEPFRIAVRKIADR
jgi:hypothetical protein